MNGSLDTPSQAYLRQYGGFSWLEIMGYVPRASVFEHIILAIGAWRQLPPDVRRAWFVPEDVQ